MAAIRYSLRRSDPWTEELRHSKHLEALRQCKTNISHKSQPLLMASSFFRLKSMKDDYYSLRRIVRDNIDLLVKLNKIQRKTGVTINHNLHKPIDQSKLKKLVKRVSAIERQNFHLGCRLLTVKGYMSTRPSHDAVIAIHRERHRRLVQVPASTMELYSHYMPSPAAAMQDKLLRPKIVLDLEVKDIRPLGHLIVQLFTEACPEMVLEFVRMATYNSVDAFRFIRIFPNLWIEGELSVENATLSRRGYAYDLAAIDHGLGPGILSFGQNYLKGFPRGLLNFSISFKPMSVLNGTRVPFGIVTAGLRVLDCLQDYGTKNGKTKKDIICVKFTLIE